MLGAIAGDVIGSVYEADNVKTPDFGPLFQRFSRPTDDTADWEDAVRKAVSLGGDSDTIACIAGGVSAAFYGSVPGEIRAEVEGRLAPPMRAILTEFLLRFPSAG